MLAVTPDNLLPACAECNHTKLADMTATLNTYFDDLGSSPWLRAHIVETTPYVPVFYLDPQPSWTAQVETRAKAHFDLFELPKLYAAQANRQLAGVRKLLLDLHASVGLAGVRLYLERTAESFAIAEPNGWETAVYSAAAASDWFCDGGFAY